MSCHSQIDNGTTSGIPIKELWGESLYNPEKNLQHSIAFMKQLTVIAISLVTYLRDIFPDSTYGTRYLAGIPVKILQNKSDDPLLQKVLSHINAVLNVLGEKCLSKLIFVIEDLDLGDKEVFTLNFKYNHPEEMKFLQNIGSRDDILKHQTKNMINKLSFMMSMKDFRPKRLAMHFRLELNEDVPDDFQIQPFSHCDEIPCIDNPASSSKITFGNVLTSYLELNMNHHTQYESINKEDVIIIENTPTDEKSTPQMIEEDVIIIENTPTDEKSTPQMIEEDVIIIENTPTDEKSTPQMIEEDVIIIENTPTDEKSTPQMIEEDVIIIENTPTDEKSTPQMIEEDVIIIENTPTDEKSTPQMIEDHAIYKEISMGENQRINKKENDMMFQDQLNNKKSNSNKRSLVIRRKIADRGFKKQHLH